MHGCIIRTEYETSITAACQNFLGATRGTAARILLTQKACPIDCNTNINNFIVSDNVIQIKYLFWSKKCRKKSAENKYIPSMTTHLMLLVVIAAV